MIFDSHAHLISSDQVKYPPAPLRGVLAPGEFDDPMTAEKLIALMDKAGVKIACAVQRGQVYGYHNDYILDSAKKYPERFRSVVVLNSADETTPPKLKELVDIHGASGVRFVSPSFPSGATDWLTTDEAHNSMKAAADLGIAICIHVLHVQRDVVNPLLRGLADKFKDATFVIDHVAGAHPAHIEQQWMKSQNLEIGEEFPNAVMSLVDCENVIMKFSTINLECSKNPSGFMSESLRLFGKDRIIWGSDIGQSRGDYTEMANLARQSVAHLEKDVQEALLFQNAYRAYVKK